MNALASIAELRALDSRSQLIRIPGEQDVPVTPRIRRMIDSQPFQRLGRISQLGLVRLVYPGATHSRLEHSLGAYRIGLLFLKRLAQDDRFTDQVSQQQAEELIIASLLHDLGHWPYCHPIEDMGLANVPAHEALAKEWMSESEIGELLRQDWNTDAGRLTSLLSGDDPADSIVRSILSGPIDIDKMDYLYRDSLHAGVPYGMNYDRQRLIGSLCLDADGKGIAITEKGATAAELMVFARYVMFSEVYWHHTVRAATAMLQRVFFRLRDQVDLNQCLRSVDSEFHASLLSASQQSPEISQEVRDLCAGLFGRQRRIYKRLCQFSYLESPEVFERIAGKSYSQLVECSERIAQALSEDWSTNVGTDEVLLDAPPSNLEVQFRVRVRFRDTGQYRWLADTSPVVRTLARQQFDNYVKRVRVFVHPRFAERERESAPLADRMMDLTQGL